MSIRPANGGRPGLRPAATALLMTATWACGAAPGTHYRGAKTYGQLPSTSGDQVAVDRVAPESARPSAPVPPQPGASAPAPAAPAPAPTAPAGPGIHADPAPDEPAKTAPGTLIRDERYAAAFDAQSAQGISDKSGYHALGGLAGAKVRGNLTTAAGDGLRIGQTYGDGVSRSVVTQDLVSSAADTNRKPGMPTVSGERRLERVTSADCPGVFLCIERMVVTPTSGAPRTVCFADAATGKAKPFPYAALPNYKAADFAAHLGAYGPFTVTAYAGADVACGSAAGATALATEEVQVEAAAADVSLLSLTLETTQPLAPQFAIALTNTRVQNDLVSPYIDETVALDGVKTFVMNADAAELTALVVTSRQSVSIAAQAGGGIIGGIASALVGIDGVAVALHFELCKDLLDGKAVDRCAVPTP